MNDFGMKRRPFSYFRTSVKNVMKKYKITKEWIGHTYNIDKIRGRSLEWEREIDSFHMALSLQQEACILS